MLEALYRELLESAQRMRAAAGAGDWDSVARLNDEHNTLVARLPAALPALDADTGRRIAALIRATLACDQEVRDQAAAWMQDAQPLLAVLARKPLPGRELPE